MGQAMNVGDAPQVPAVNHQETQVMALTLLKKFGPQAHEIARGFAAEHRLVGDHVRARNWDGVCAVLAPKRTLS